MGDNSKKFGALAEESKSSDVCGIHQPPIQAADDTSGKTYPVPGKGLPFFRRRSSDAAEKLTGLPFASLICQIVNPTAGTNSTG